MTDFRRAGELLAEALALLVPQAIPATPSARLLSVPEIRARWSCGETLVRQLIKSGRLMSVRIGDGAVRVPLASIEEYEKRQTVERKPGRSRQAGPSGSPVQSQEQSRRSNRPGFLSAVVRS